MNDKHWTIDTDDKGIAWLQIDKAESAVNVLSTEVMLELEAKLNSLREKPPQGLVIYSGKQSGFVMGADISEFSAVSTPDLAYEVTRRGQKLFDQIEALPCPTVTVVNGFCLGGGLELAMSTDYRIALPNKKPILGLPEVQLGLHPGFGGTVRAVQICGVRPGMQLMLTGKPITADKAKRIGLVDRIASEDEWRQAAVSLINSGAAKHQPALIERILNLGFVRPFIKSTLIKQVASKARKDHYPAPYAMIDLWAEHGASSKTGYEAEARSFADLMCTDTSKNLVRVFFLQNKLKNQGNKLKSKVGHVHVIGAGVMGGDIAAFCAYRGIDVTLQDREDKYIQPAIERAHKMFGKRIRDNADRDAAIGRLQPDVEGNGVAKADLIIEAIYENLDAKKALYATVEKTLRPDAIIATNTSSIPLQELRVDLRNPKRFIGVHFFNPVAQMPLVEIVRCEDTEQEAIDAGLGFVKQISKFPLECASKPGFVVNRILAPYMTEAMHLVGEGVSLPAIDKVAEEFGMPMGPIELVDSVGLDVVSHVSKVLGTDMQGPAADRLNKLIDEKHLGRKTGQGLYTWVDGKAQKDSAGEQAPADAKDRLILSMVNEAVACLADNVVTDPDLLDAGVIFGTGFAPFRGGPIKYARDRGVENVVARLGELAETHGARFDPHPGWSDIRDEN